MHAIQQIVMHAFIYIYVHVGILAGDIVRSKSRYATLDETGVLGVACRHKFPFCFFSLHHGER